MVGSLVPPRAFPPNNLILYGFFSKIGPKLYVWEADVYQ